MNKFCMPFKRSKYYNADVKEFSIKYKNELEKLTDFLTFVDPEQRVNIKIEALTQEDVDNFILIKAKHPDTNFALVVRNIDTLAQFQSQLLDAKIPYYVDCFCDSMSFFLGLVKLKVCDILIGGDLGFMIKDISEAAHRNNINVRVCCNLAQSIICTEVADDIVSFFVRPEDVEVYSQYVDTFEFFDPERDNYNLDVIYEVYAKDGKWSGRLSEIMIEFEDTTNNFYLMPNFADRRLNCGKKCALGKCKLCYELNTLCATMEEKKIAIRPS